MNNLFQKKKLIKVVLIKMAVVGLVFDNLFFFLYILSLVGHFLQLNRIQTRFLYTRDHSQCFQWVIFRSYKLKGQKKDCFNKDLFFA